MWFALRKYQISNANKKLFTGKLCNLYFVLKEVAAQFVFKFNKLIYHCCCQGIRQGSAKRILKKHHHSWIGGKSSRAFHANSHRTGNDSSNFTYITFPLPLNVKFTLDWAGGTIRTLKYQLVVSYNAIHFLSQTIRNKFNHGIINYRKFIH